MLAVNAGDRSIARELWQAVLEHDVAGLAAQLAYRFALAMLWLLIFFAALSGFVAGAFGGANPTQRLMESAFVTSPADVQPVLEASWRWRRVSGATATAASPPCSRAKAGV